MMWLGGLWTAAGLVAAWPLLGAGLWGTLALGPVALWSFSRWRGWPRVLTWALGWTLGLAAMAAGEGDLGAALAGMGIALVAWDLSLISLRAPAIRGTFLLLQLARSAGVTGAGLALAGGLSHLSLTLPFWGLLALACLSWLLISTVIWLSRQAQPPGGTASGNRSSAGPME